MGKRLRWQKRKEKTKKKNSKQIDEWRQYDAKTLFNMWMRIEIHCLRNCGKSPGLVFFLIVKQKNAKPANVWDAFSQHSIDLLLFAELKIENLTMQIKQVHEREKKQRKW